MRRLRALRKPPRYIAWRLLRELRSWVDRFFAPRRARSFDQEALLRAVEAPDLESLWNRLGQRPFCAPMTIDAARLDALCPGEAARVRAAAAEALARRVRLLGSAPTELGQPIDWSRDFKVGIGWPRRYFRDIKLIRRNDPSDVKVPWELSRLQWLLPVAQAYLLDRDENRAGEARAVLEEWIDHNPYAQSVNWGCAMEAALRILSWTYLFHAFHSSEAWRAPGFRSEFLRALYLHADFVERHIERSDINGNHYTADAAGLVFAGLFFDKGRAPERWKRLGWAILEDELPRQVHDDGVDFEASSAYHRLVLELFLLPALHRRANRLPVPEKYRRHLIAMAGFVAAYSRPDGRSPLWGDADDGRALPLGGQDLNDHRYLVGLVGIAFDDPELITRFQGPRSEVFWLLGSDGAARLPDRSVAVGSSAFTASGVFVMRNAGDHVFVDCGPPGMAGRGGHGHNDCLSFEACLAGRSVVSDAGTLTYSGDPAERNRFRSTRAHNTPLVDGQEINRLPLDDLWRLGDDARPVRRWFRFGPVFDLLVGAHTGYHRLADPVTPVRTFLLNHAYHALVVQDAFECRSSHQVEIPLHLAPGVDAELLTDGELRVRLIGAVFRIAWGSVASWRLELRRAYVSPSYGAKAEIHRLAWKAEGMQRDPLVVCVAPEPNVPADLLTWAREQLAAAGAKSSTEL